MVWEAWFTTIGKDKEIKWMQIGEEGKLSDDRILYLKIITTLPENPKEQ